MNRQERKKQQMTVNDMDTLFSGRNIPKDGGSDLEGYLVRRKRAVVTGNSMDSEEGDEFDGG